MGGWGGWLKAGVGLTRGGILEFQNLLKYLGFLCPVKCYGVFPILADNAFISYVHNGINKRTQTLGGVPEMILKGF